MATNAPRYVPNRVLHTDLQMPTIREEITRLSSNYKTKIEVHTNELTTSLFEVQADYAATHLLICPLDSYPNLLDPELFFLVLAHPVYKMRIIQEPNTIEI